MKALWIRRLEKGRIDPELLNESKEVLLEKLHLTSGGYFETDANLMYQDEVRDSLLEIVDKIVELVYLKYMRAKITYVGMQRRERYFVPKAALRETLFNALCHSQYNYGVPIQISVYVDKLYIANCGCLPENWTVENLMGKHASRPYNPNIAHIFYLAGFIESWGRGIEKICETCTTDSLPLPEFTINPGDIMVKFSSPEDRVVHRPERVTEKGTERVCSDTKGYWKIQSITGKQFQL